MSYKIVFVVHPGPDEMQLNTRSLADEDSALDFLIKIVSEGGFNEVKGEYALHYMTVSDAEPTVILKTYFADEYTQHIRDCFEPDRVTVTSPL